MGVTVLCHEISLILISTSSLLMDRILDNSFYSFGKPHEHCYGPACQLGIWLVLSLSMSIPRSFVEAKNNNEPYVLIEPWLHMTLVTQLLRSTLTMAHARRRCRRQRYRVGAILLFLLQGVSVAGWMTSIFVVAAGARGRRHNSEMSLLGSSCQVFGGSLVILAVGRWVLDYTSTMMTSSPNKPNSSIINYYPTSTTTMTTTTTNTSSSLSLDESQWYLWDTRQTGRWLEQRWTTREDPNEDEEKGIGTIVQEILSPHRLCGDVLDSLTLTQLVHALHVPYGPAVVLVRDIARLTHLYPKPASPNEVLLVGRGMNPSWLEVHDREHYLREGMGGPSHSYSSFPSRQDVMGTPADDHATRGPELPPSIDPQLEERLATLMKERYGIELPILRTSTRSGPHNDDDDDDIDNNNNDHKKQSSHGHDTFSSSSSSSTNIPSIVVKPQVPLHRPAPPSLQDPSNHHTLSPRAILLENMPARIREIAERRPDLVQALLLKQQQQQQHRQRQRLTPNGTVVVPEDEEEELEDDMDDETASLVQRQPRRPYNKPSHGEIV